MSYALPPYDLAVLQDYAAGRLGTREAIERAGLDDYADLLVAMATNGLAMPKPTESPEHAARIALATEWLQPLLRRPH